MRNSCLLVLGIVPLVSSAAPIPKESDGDKLRRIYGVWHDPDKDCKFALKGNELQVSLPAESHLLWPDREGSTNNAPRLLREVEGDFTAIVRVTFPVPMRVPKGFWPNCSGGLLAWESEKEYLIIRRAGGMINANPEAICRHHSTATEHTLSVVGTGKQAESAFIRLIRTGNKVVSGWSLDGKTWKDFDPVEVAWGAKVKVGVVAENCLGVPVEITFDQYSLTQPKKK